MEISLVPQNEIWRVWPKTFEHILKSVNASGKRESMNSILEELLSDTATLWIAFDDDFVIKSSATLKMISYPDDVYSMRVCHIGGEQGITWFNLMHKKFTSYARDSNCDFLEAECIPKWGAFMKRCGAEELSRVYRLSIKGE